VYPVHQIPRALVLVRHALRNHPNDASVNNRNNPNDASVNNRNNPNEVPDDPSEVRRSKRGVSKPSNTPHVVQNDSVEVPNDPNEASVNHRNNPDEVPNDPIE